MGSSRYAANSPPSERCDKETANGSPWGGTSRAPATSENGPQGEQRGRPLQNRRRDGFAPIVAVRRFMPVP
jgi:hypothetical protein